MTRTELADAVSKLADSASESDLNHASVVLYALAASMRLGIEGLMLMHPAPKVIEAITAEGMAKETTARPNAEWPEELQP